MTADSHEAHGATVAIVGAGLGGLACAARLSQLVPGAAVTLFDKGRVPGGRLCTKTSGDRPFDHGPQWLTCRTEAFTDCLKGLEASGHVARWQPRAVTFKDGSATPLHWGHPHYVGTPNMNSVAEALAMGRTVECSTKVTALERAADGLWWLQCEGEDSPRGPFAVVVLNMPAPQALALLPEGHALDIPLASARMAPCLTLMLTLAESPALDWDLAVFERGPLALVAANHSKPGRPDAPAMVAHSSPEWAQQHLDEAPEAAEAALLAAVLEQVPALEERVVATRLHRWRYASIERPVELPYLLDTASGLAAIGDWCLANRAEAAFTSGYELAGRLSGQLQ